LAGEAEWTGYAILVPCYVERGVLCTRYTIMDLNSDAQQPDRLQDRRTGTMKAFTRIALRGRVKNMDHPVYLRHVEQPPSVAAAGA